MKLYGFMTETKLKQLVSFLHMEDKSIYTKDVIGESFFKKICKTTAKHNKDKDNNTYFYFKVMSDT